jgi:hypothetical protein
MSDEPKKIEMKRGRLGKVQSSTIAIALIYPVSIGPSEFLECANLVGWSSLRFYGPLIECCDAVPGARLTLDAYRDACCELGLKLRAAVDKKP